jgi:hypothetical protein
LGRPRTYSIILVLALALLSTSIAAGEKAGEDAYKFTPYKPVFRANERLEYSIYWNGLKVGYMFMWSGDTPGEGQPCRYYYSEKSSRLGKIVLNFFSTTANCRVDREDGSSKGFFRHMATDHDYLEETVNFNYETMDLHQMITRDRHKRPVERFRLIEDRMMDPVSMLWHPRAVPFEKVGDKREYYLFADGFFTVAMKVNGRKTVEVAGLGERDAWLVEMAVPKLMLSHRTGAFSLEIDVPTGIILIWSWADTGGTCRARLTGATNSPLPFRNEAAEDAR